MEKGDWIRLIIIETIILTAGITTAYNIAKTNRLHNDIMYLAGQTAECPWRNQTINNYTIGQIFDTNRKVLGLAYGPYFIVWTEGRNIEQVLETCTHEYAHNNLGLKDPQ